ncbi:penicillin-binding protein [Alkalibacillus filiformis]|uniref:Penicillin-binding protein n=1 Tax=Alkalibacillus filiformis TaxID=200990 RepID=A0ABU0DSD9_9BACI|nr:transglycosylase domain-containing protein [Alkalibacillus filiformis]MDQ0351275.1 penicillin-binding protein [Alkalibacillus filiformis]
MGHNNSKNRFLAFFQGDKFPKITRISLDIVWNVALFFLIVGLIAAFFAGGLGLGYMASLVEDVDVSEAEEMEQMVYNYEETSDIYFANDVYLGPVRGDIHREEIETEHVAGVFIDALIATEDEYFEEHNGIVPKAIMRALYQEFTGAATQTGGSTLTQQLVKNQILTNEVSFERKAEEIFIALRMENFFDKEDILEAYLNVVPFGRDSTGRNIAGIQAAAQGIFDVDADELNLPQAAYIAGLPQSPYAYTPYASGGSLKEEEQLQPGLNRMQTVLSRMLSAEKITEEEYEEALEYDVVGDFTDKRESIRDEYPWVAQEVEGRATDILAEKLAEEAGDLEEYHDVGATKSHYEDLARHQLRHDGLEIHTTINKDIHDHFQDSKDSFEHYMRTKTINVEDPNTGEIEQEEIPNEAGALMMENSTGAILGFVGGRDFERREVNHAIYEERPPGSTMKPLFGYAVGMELGMIQPGSPLLDISLDYWQGESHGWWTPTNFVRGQEKGLVSARSALTDSDNIPIVRAMINILERDNEPSRFLDRMNIEGANNGPATVLGEDPYISVEDNVAAFATFTNDGNYIEPYMVEKIVDRNGDVIYEHETESEEVFSPQTSYLMLDMMRDVISSGTASRLNNFLNNPSVDWAGKTGTSGERRDAWFIGSNPNVTVGTWMGYYRHDHAVNVSDLDFVEDDYSSRNLRFWSELVNAAAEVDADLVTPSDRFSTPGGIVSRSYCALSGNIPSDMCEELGLVQTDLFNIEHAPSEEDDSFTTGRFVEIDGERFAAVEETPEEFTSEGMSIDQDFIDQLGWGTTYRSGWSDPVDIEDVLGSGDWSDLMVANDDELEDDGTPNSPSSLSLSGSTLTWNQADGQVIGYRIYISDEEDGDFEEIGHTTETEYNLPSEGYAYAVSAVSLYGHESGLSDSIIYGTIEDEEDEEEEENEEEAREDDDDDDDDEDQDEEASDEQDGNEDEEASDEQDGNEDDDDSDDDNDEDNDDDGENGEDDEEDEDGEIDELI